MQFSIGSKINSGRFANVYIVTKNGKEYAAKLLPKHRIDIPDAKNQKMIEREIHNHKLVNGHPNIVRLEEVVEDWGNHYLIEELCDGDLQNVMDSNMRMSDALKKKVLKDCLRGLLACHKAGFIFGDLKPANVLVSDNFKLCDFGSTDNVTDLYTGSTCIRGTPIYMAPETVVYGQPHGQLADMWSLGMMAYVLFYNRYPYDIECSHKELIEQMRDVEICYSGKVPAGSEEFIRKCLEADVYKRLKPTEALASEFLS
jgi:serine/threonine protein kinase